MTSSPAFRTGNKLELFIALLLKIGIRILVRMPIYLTVVFHSHMVGSESVRMMQSALFSMEKYRK